MIRNICVVTGGRSDYGLLRLLMREIQKCRKFKLQVIATGSHFLSRFGSTYREISKDRFKIDARVDMKPSGDLAVVLGKAMGIGIEGMNRAFAKLRPDLILLLGDRYEILAAATAATLASIPIAHLHGGELTEGAYDDAFRHAITKMSHLHFTSTGLYRQRVIQMGEQPSRVFHVGALGVDNVLGQTYVNRDKLSKILHFQFQKKNLLITFHPTTLEPGEAGRQTKALLSALKNFSEAGFIFTMPGADKENATIWKKIEAFAMQNPRAKVFRALGSRLYLSVMREVDAVVGNSSSGLLEAPVLNKPVVNIGNRQQGRVRWGTVIDCGNSTPSIRSAIRRALRLKTAKTGGVAENPYGQGGAAKKIVRILCQQRRKGLLSKTFFDHSG